MIYSIFSSDVVRLEQLLHIGGQTSTASVSANKINGIIPIDCNSWSNMSAQRLSEEV